MSKFLNTDELYRLLQRELPEDVYPDGAPEAFYSTAENHSVARSVSGVYLAMEQVYNNFFPQSATEQISDWEVKVFGKTLDAALSVQQRRDRLIGQLRSQLSISLWDLLTFVNSYVPAGTFTRIVEYNGAENEIWILNQSQLNLDTILGFGQIATIYDESACDTANSLWLSNPAAIEAIRKQAYFFEIQIFGYQLSSIELADLIDNVQQLDPARSDFIVRQNLVLADFFLTTPVNNVERISNIHCIARDSSSTTGYIGRKKT